MVPSIARTLGIQEWTRTSVTSKLTCTIGAVPVHLWCMPAPHSFTGQDTLEIFSPGHPGITAAISDWLETQQAIHAEAGEFTRLAVDSGKLDLSRAEAVMSLVTAHDDASRRRALADLSGESAESLRSLTDEFRRLSARYEMLFDFAEEEHAEAEENRLQFDLTNLTASLNKFVGSESSAHSGTPKIALFGPPNAGKSSLFNAMLGKPRSLVTNLPGTTRDAVSETIRLGAIDSTLTDLSGIGDLDADGGAFDEVATQTALESDILLVLASPKSADETASLFENLEKQDASIRGRAIWVYTMADLESSKSENPSALEQISVSSLSGQGLEALNLRLAKRLESSASGNAISLQRQKASEAKKVLAGVQTDSDSPPEAIAQQVRLALRLLDDALLSQNPGDVLDLIFSRFCIGK
jgi:tRNA modification GTPase